MKISSRGRYALRFLIDVAENSGDGVFVSIKDVSKRQEISVKYLEQIAPYLVRNRLLRSVRGPSGGYMLSKPACRYTAGEIIRAAEGKLAPVACLDDKVNRCKRKNVCRTLDLWKNLQNIINEYLDSVSLADLAGCKKKKRRIIKPKKV